jgi:hypothetical protein
MAALLVSLVVVAACSPAGQAATFSSANGSVRSPMPPAGSPYAASAASASAITPVPGGASPGAEPPEGVVACSAQALLLEIHPSGATGSVYLGIRAMNVGQAACWLQGPPRSLGLRSGGSSLAIDYAARTWRLDDDTRSEAGVVVLEPGGTAVADAIWRNWCDVRAPVDTVWVGIAESPQAVDVHPSPIDAPRCDAASADSTLDGFAFHDEDD